MKICAVVPTYNHARVIADVVLRLRAAGLPVFVIDDGSGEAAAPAIAALHDPGNSVRVHRFPVNQGKGVAVLHGFDLAWTAGFTHAVQADADGQHDLDALPLLLREARAHPAALISGCAIFDRSIPIGRKIGRWVTHVWVWIETWSFQIRDSMCGFRVYPLAAVRALLENERVGRHMDFDTDIMVRLFWRGTGVRQVPVRVIYPKDNISNFHLLRDNVRISAMHTRLVLTRLGRLVVGVGRFLRVIPAAARVVPAAPRVIPSVPRVIPSVPRVIPSVPRVIPSVPRVIPGLVPGIYLGSGGGMDPRDKPGDDTCKPGDEPCKPGDEPCKPGDDTWKHGDDAGAGEGGGDGAGKTHWANLAERGALWGLDLLAFIYRLLGPRACRVIMQPAVLYFYLSGREQRRASRDFLTRVTKRSATRRDSYRHFRDFAVRTLEGFVGWSQGVPDGAIIPDNPASLAHMAADRRGALFVVAHFGNSDLARAVLDAPTRARLTVLVHSRHAENFAEVLRRHRPDAMRNLVQVTDLGPERAIDLKQRVERGEWVVIAGDRTPVLKPGDTSRTHVSRVPFFGTDAPFPHGPWIIASLLGCPVYLLFCPREGDHWRLTIELFADCITLPRATRQAALRDWCARYAEALERHVRPHPTQWYNFYDFWAG